MLQFIMEQNVLLYVLTAACVIGAASQIILKQIYEKLIRDTRNMGEPEGRFLQQLRQRFQYCTHLNEKVGDVQALIRKSIMEYRVWGMNLHQWKRLGLQCLTVSLVCAFAGTMALVQRYGTIVSASLYLWMAAGAVTLTAAAYGIADTKYRRESLEVRLTDYLENSGAVRDYSEQTQMDETEANVRMEEAVTPILSVAQGRKAKRRAKAEAAAAQTRAKAEAAIVQTRAQKEKADLKENLARMKAGMQETAAERERSERERNAELIRQMDPKEQERILREVLKDFLS